MNIYKKLWKHINNFYCNNSVCIDLHNNYYLLLLADFAKLSIHTSHA